MRTGLAAGALMTANALLAPRSYGAIIAVQAGNDAGTVMNTVADRLERMRQNPALADDPAAIDALARDADSLAPCALRVKARMFVAQMWLGQMHRPEDALRLLRNVTEDAEADPLTARLAEREIVEASIADGRLDEAATEARTHANRLDPRLVDHTRTLIRRRGIRRVALAELSAFVGLVAISFVRASRRGSLAVVARSVRGLTPMALFFGGYVATVGGILASQYDAGNAQPFVLLGCSIVPIVLLARGWGAAGSARALARGGRAMLCAVSVVAAAFVLLDALDATYLEGFGQ